MRSRFQTESILSVLLVGTVPVAAQRTPASRTGTWNAVDQLGTGSSHLPYEERSDAARLGVLLERSRVLHSSILFHDFIFQNLLLALQMVEFVGEIFRLFVEMILLLQRLTQKFVILRQQHGNLIDQVALIFLQCVVPLLQNFAFIVHFAQFHVHVGHLQNNLGVSQGRKW